MFANRLQKNLRQLGKWARRDKIECYRLYDADMPEYALAVDIYGDWVHVQEYAAPKSIDPAKPRRACSTPWRRFCRPRALPRSEWWSSAASARPARSSTNGRAARQVPRGG